MVKNGLHAIALNQRLAFGPSLWSRQGLAQLQALVLMPHTRRRRDDSLELLHWLNRHIDELDLHSTYYTQRVFRQHPFDPPRDLGAGLPQPPRTV